MASGDEESPESIRFYWARPDLDLGSGVGVFLPCSLSNYASLSQLWDCVDQNGVGFLAVDDHLLSPDDDGSGSQLECWSLLAAMAERTSHPVISALVSPASLRSAAITAKASVTVDHISGGRFLLGLGAGWLAKEYELARLPFEPMAVRVKQLESVVQQCRAIWTSDAHSPPALRGIPVMVGGAGLTHVIPAAARIANLWNSDQAFPRWTESNEALTSACEAIGREPSSVLRTALIQPGEVHTAARYKNAGVDLLIIKITAETTSCDQLAHLVGAAELEMARG